MDLENVYYHFYRIQRIAADTLSDGGGPFGFDITKAIEFDYLITRYNVDAIIETGSNVGDTTEYLARAYPHLAVFSCEIVRKYQGIVARRTQSLHNVDARLCDSRELIADVKDQFASPLYYLDAHWYDDWPLQDEINLIDSGVVCIDDFDIGDPRFGFDEYEGLRCGPEILQPFADKIPRFYINTPWAKFPLPILQTERRSGRAYYSLGMEQDYFAVNKWFTCIENKADAKSNSASEQALAQA